MEKYKYMVQTRCMTYNHAPYIVEAMNGFCMQQTTFPFVCVIVDDASMDGEPEVIEKYLQEHFNLGDSAVARRKETDDYRLVFAQHKTNKNCFFVVLYLKYNHYVLKKDKQPYYAEWTDASKYIAMCEGDDYWTDPLKLQKQVDFLERHEDYIVCWHRCKHYIEEEMKYKLDVNCDTYLSKGMEGVEVTIPMFFKSWITQPLSMMYRNGIVLNIDKSKYSDFRDTYQIYHLLKIGRGYLMNFFGGVYNFTGKGVASSLNIVQSCQFELQSADELYDINRDVYTYQYWQDTVLWSLQTYKAIGRKDLYWHLIRKECKQFPFVMTRILSTHVKRMLKKKSTH